MPPEPQPPPPPRTPARMAIQDRPWDEEREKIIEREWFERRSPRPAGGFVPPMPPMSPRDAGRERRGGGGGSEAGGGVKLVEEKVIVIRE